jgi:hypothetical protein
MYLTRQDGADKIACRLEITTGKPGMDRSATISFFGQLRDARENALRDAEAFDGIIQVLERLGSLLLGEIGTLDKYRKVITNKVDGSALAKDIPEDWRDVHIPFSRLYELVRIARNDALHQGAFARHLTIHAIELSLVLEDALMSSLDNPTVGDFMVRNPICAELWQPISYIRQQMLASSFSFLPIKVTKDGV